MPAERLLVLFTAQLAADPEATVQRVVEFLDLPPHQPADFPRLNVAPYPDMDTATRASLEAYFAPHDGDLVSLLGRDLGW